VSQRQRSSRGVDLAGWARPGAGASCRPPATSSSVSTCSSPERYQRLDLAEQGHEVLGHGMGITIVVVEMKNILLFGCYHRCSFRLNIAMSVSLRNEYIRSSIMSWTP
uniref:Uncharacterized protein n=1 Tax=Triticum urartu TaxID=4572 RepID=A0A8R7U0E6_TRIUA